MDEKCLRCPTVSSPDGFIVPAPGGSIREDGASVSSSQGPFAGEAPQTGHLILKGTLGGEGNPGSLPEVPQVGWAYLALEAGTYGGHAATPGDLIYCTSLNPLEWGILQADADYRRTTGSFSCAFSSAAREFVVGMAVCDGDGDFTQPARTVFTLEPDGTAEATFLISFGADGMGGCAVSHPFVSSIPYDADDRDGVEFFRDAVFWLREGTDARYVQTFSDGLTVELWAVAGASESGYSHTLHLKAYGPKASGIPRAFALRTDSLGGTARHVLYLSEGGSGTVSLRSSYAAAYPRTSVNTYLYTSEFSGYYSGYADPVVLEDGVPYTSEYLSVTLTRNGSTVTAVAKEYEGWLPDLQFVTLTLTDGTNVSTASLKCLVDWLNAETGSLEDAIAALELKTDRKADASEALSSVTGAFSCGTGETVPIEASSAKLYFSYFDYRDCGGMPLEVSNGHFIIRGSEAEELVCGSISFGEVSIVDADGVERLFSEMGRDFLNLINRMSVGNVAYSDDGIVGIKLESRTELTSDDEGGPDIVYEFSALRRSATELLLKSETAAGASSTQVVDMSCLDDRIVSVTGQFFCPLQRREPYTPYHGAELRVYDADGNFLKKTVLSFSDGAYTIPPLSDSTVWPSGSDHAGLSFTSAEREGDYHSIYYWNFSCSDFSSLSAGDVIECDTGCSVQCLGPDVCELEVSSIGSSGTVMAVYAQTMSAPALALTLETAAGTSSTQTVDMSCLGDALDYLYEYKADKTFATVPEIESIFS